MREHVPHTRLPPKLRRLPKSKGGTVQEKDESLNQGEKHQTPRPGLRTRRASSHRRRTRIQQFCLMGNKNGRPPTQHPNIIRASELRGTHASNSSSARVELKSWSIFFEASFGGLILSSNVALMLNSSRPQVTRVLENADVPRTHLPRSSHALTTGGPCSEDACEGTARTHSRPQQLRPDPLQGTLCVPSPAESAESADSAGPLGRPLPWL